MSLHRGIEIVLFEEGHRAANDCFLSSLHTDNLRVQKSRINAELLRHITIEVEDEETLLQYKEVALKFVASADYSDLKRRCDLQALRHLYIDMYGPLAQGLGSMYSEPNPLRGSLDEDGDGCIKDDATFSVYGAGFEAHPSFETGDNGVTSLLAYCDLIPLFDVLASDNARRQLPEIILPITSSIRERSSIQSGLVDALSKKEFAYSTTDQVCAQLRQLSAEHLIILAGMLDLALLNLPSKSSSVLKLTSDDVNSCAKDISIFDVLEIARRVLTDFDHHNFLIACGFATAYSDGFAKALNRRLEVIAEQRRIAEGIDYDVIEMTSEDFGYWLFSAMASSDNVCDMSRDKLIELVIAKQGTLKLNPPQGYYWATRILNAFCAAIGSTNSMIELYANTECIDVKAQKRALDKARNRPPAGEPLVERLIAAIGERRVVD